MSIRTGYIFLQLIILVLPFAGFTQNSKNTNPTIDSLREELRKANLILQSTRDQADRLTYLLTAKEMALRSIELRDSVFQGLVAIQAYKFNKDHKGNPTDIDIYRALYKALKRFDDSLIKDMPSESDKNDKDLATRAAAMANQLCTRMKRNMRVEEWNKFAGQLAYESTCPFPKK